MPSIQLLSSFQLWLGERLQVAGAKTPPQFVLLLTIVALLAFAVVAYFLAKLLFQRVAGILVKKSKTHWDDALLKNRFFFWLAQLAPGVVLYTATEAMLGEPEPWGNFIRNGSILYMVLVAYLASAALLNGSLVIYRKFPISKEIPIRSFIQVAKLILFVITVIVLMSVLLDKSPIYFLSGLWAITAVLMLIFKDAILGLVAGVQLAANRMVARGDWIEMPKYGADGTVIDIALTTVKVQNFDNTITTVPTYALISDSFKNWRGMEDSGGRRIKRSLKIDINTVGFCDEALLKELRKIDLIADYLMEREAEIAKERSECKGLGEHQVNSRALTNLGTFRAYVRAYVENHPMIHQELTVLVRQLPSTENGLPLEIYVFSKDKNWVNYEGLQADIFDHVFAILPAFKLRAFQRGTDYPPPPSSE